jgi:small conductance mechanosensitive channel
LVELNIDSIVSDWAPRIIGLILVWTLVYIIVRYLSHWIENFDEHIKQLDFDRRDIKTIDRILDYITILIGGIVSLAILGWTSLLYSALTAAGVFSIIIGFALKDVAANFISGIFILLDRPFVPGDFIKTGDYSGTVQNVSLRSTTIVTLDGPVVFIPNSVLAVQPTTNYTVAQDRRINFNLSIANEADIGQALEIIRRVLADTEGLLAEKTQLVLVNEVREYAVDIQVICYAPPDTFINLGSDLKQQVIKVLQEDGVELAVPTRKYVNADVLVAQAQPSDD